MPDGRDTGCAAILAELTQVGRSVFADPLLELLPETAADDVPGWDSMNHIALIVETECRFDIQLDDIEIENIATVGDLVRLIQSKLAVHSRQMEAMHGGWA